MYLTQRPATTVYFTALNAARLAAERFAQHLKEHGVDPSAPRRLPREELWGEE